jgi:hypothetical protein
MHPEGGLQGARDRSVTLGSFSGALFAGANASEVRVLASPDRPRRRLGLRGSHSVGNDVGFCRVGSFPPREGSAGVSDDRVCRPSRPSCPPPQMDRHRLRLHCARPGTSGRRRRGRVRQQLPRQTSRHCDPERPPAEWGHLSLYDPPCRQRALNPPGSRARQACTTTALCI